MIIKVLFQINNTKNNGKTLLRFLSILVSLNLNLLAKEILKIQRLFWPEKFIRYIVG